MINIDIRKSENCNGKASLFMTFPYDETVINLIRSFPNRFWDTKQKAWEVPYKELPVILEELPTYTFDITVSDPKLLEASKPIDVANIIDNFKFKTSPYQHQIDGVIYGLQHDKWLLGDSMGLGKSKQSIDIAVAKKSQYGYKHCLVICGVNGLKWNWVNEVATHSDEHSWILGQKQRGNHTVIGSNADKVADIKALKDGELEDKYFIITNIESLRDEDIVKGLSELCDNNTINMIIADECHMMKNPSSQQGKGFLKLKADSMIAMTGTPLLNTPLDLYIILKWLGYENHTFYSFRNHYCKMGGFGGYQIVGYQHLNELQAKLDEMMLRRKKEDVLDLPEKTYINEYVEMSDKQRIIYNEISSEIKMNIDQIKMASNPLAELIRMRQATGYTGILSSSIKVSAKLDRMEELVEDSVSDGKKVVIFSNWTQMTDAIYERLNKNYKGIAVITGQTKDADRQNLINKFQNDEDCNIMIGTIGALGTGVTLSSASVVIFVDHPWTRGVYDQAVDRLHRIGQTSNILIYNLLCKNTIDEKILAIINKKGAMSDMIVDNMTPTDKSVLIDFLLDD